ncbi:MAG: DsrE/DsrF/DrsH-like family protein [Thermoplasmata archaeon]
MTIVAFSGTVDKLMSVGILTSGAVAMGMDVDIYLTFWGLQALRQGAPPHVTKMSSDYGEMAPMMMQLIQEKNMPSWLDTLRQAKELGNVKVHACANTMDLMGMTREDLDPMVDDVVGVAEYVELARNSEITLFI